MRSFVTSHQWIRMSALSGLKEHYNISSRPSHQWIRMSALSVLKEHYNISSRLTIHFLSAFISAWGRCKIILEIKKVEIEGFKRVRCTSAYWPWTWLQERSAGAARRSHVVQLSSSPLSTWERCGLDPKVPCSIGSGDASFLSFM